jgi:GT2 family glycosyltransferase
VPSIAVVIATRDRPALLEDALAALARSDRSAERVVVVDSASTDSRVSDIALSHGATLIRCQQPGACRARNVGWNATNEDFVAFTDDDCLVTPGWLDSLLTAFEHPTQPQFVTGLVRPEVAPSSRASLSVALITDPDEKVIANGDDLRTIGHGANMAWRRECLERLGGFDEQLGPGAALRAAEDLDLFWRALSARLTGYYTPLAVVVHRQWRTRREMLRTYHSYGIGSGALTLKRHRSADSGPDRLGRLSAARTLLVEDGLAPVLRAVSEHYEMGALAELVKLAGSLEGAWRARRMAVVNGHFSPVG